MYFMQHSCPLIMTPSVILDLSPAWAVSDQQRARCRGISRESWTTKVTYPIESEGFALLAVPGAHG